jgi:hypothetical protein
MIAAQAVIIRASFSLRGVICASLPLVRFWPALIAAVWTHRSYDRFLTAVGRRDRFREPTCGDREGCWARQMPQRVDAEAAQIQSRQSPRQARINSGIAAVAALIAAVASIVAAFLSH